MTDMFGLSKSETEIDNVVFPWTYPIITFNLPLLSTKIKPTIMQL